MMRGRKLTFYQNQSPRRFLKQTQSSSTMRTYPAIAWLQNFTGSLMGLTSIRELGFLEQHEAKTHLQEPVDYPLHNRHIVLWGDSITRYQYLSLVLYLHTGRWTAAKEGLFGDSNGRSPFDSWAEFFNHTTSLLDGNEQCDCSRQVPGPHTMYENRHYHDKKRNIYVTYLQKMGKNPSHGHLGAATVYEEPRNTTFIELGRGRGGGEKQPYL
jgi:hypothetical protein